MKTTKALLPAYNKLYDLGISDTQLEKLYTCLDSIKESDVINSISYIMRVKNQIITASCSRYGSKEYVYSFETIDNRQLEKESTGIIEENSVLQDNQNNWDYTVDEEDDTDDDEKFEHDGDSDDPNDVKVKTKESLKDGESCYCISISRSYGNFPIYLMDYSDKDIESYLTLDKFSNTFSMIQTVGAEILSNGHTNIDTFIQALSEQFLLRMNDVNRAERKNSSSDILNMLLKMFPTAKHTQLSEAQLIPYLKKLKLYNRLSLITDVFEYKNHRILIIANMQTYYAQYKIIIMQPDDRGYDYADVGRIFMSSVTFSNDKKLGDMIFTEDPILPNAQIIADNLIRLIDPETTLLIENSDLRNVINESNIKLKRDQDEKNQRATLSTKIKKKLEAIQKDPVKFNDVEYSTNKIEYHGQQLIMNETNWVKNFVGDVMSKYSDIDNITFDSIFDEFIREFSSKKNISGTIGNVPVTLRIEGTKNTKSITSYKSYINDIRVNNEEVGECLRRTLCFTTQEDYDAFIETVSSCSLKFHKYLHNGISIDVKDTFSGGGVTLKFPLDRKKNINYLVLDKKDFRVSDTNRLLQLESATDLSQVMNVLLAGEVVKGVNVENIKPLFDAARKEYIDAKTRSEQLLKETEQLFKIHLEQIKLGDKTIKGYIINGKNRQYALEYPKNDDTRPGVYEYPSGRYICIVDKSTAQVGKDQLINRIFALHNDSVIANEVHNLR